MFGKVSTQEIKNIKERLSLELGDKNLPAQRREEATSLLSYISTWLEWKDDQELIKPTGSIIPQKDWFKPVKSIGIFPKPEIERKDSNKWKGKNE